MQTITETLTLETETCCSCGSVFAMSRELRRQRRTDGHWFYCPNGHAQHYSKTEVMKLREELDMRTRSLVLANQKLDQTRAEVSEKTQQLEKLKAGVAKGKCPCCNRYFGNLHRHMATKHPGLKAKKP